MSTYNYVALNSFGKKTKGIVDADNEKEATAAVRKMQLTPISLKEQGVMTADIDIHFGKVVNSRDLSVFCRQMQSMINAGITVVDALDMLAEQTENKYMEKAITGVKDKIQGGESFGDALKSRRDIFPSMMISMIEAGEASGSLEIALDRMATQFEKDTKLKQMIKKAMVYPVIVILVAIAVVIVLLTVVVPSFMSMFADMDIDMPKITLAVIAVSNFMKKFWIVIVLVVVGLFVGFKAFKQSEGGKYILGRLALKIPAIANFVKKTSASRFARTMSTLTAAGVPITEALEITANTMTNVLFRDAVLDAREEVMKGMPLAVPIKASGIFPPMVTHMTKIGEETGKLEQMLEKMADYYDDEVEVATQQLLSAMEPMITLILAGIVVVIIAAVFSPMLAMYNGLDNI